MRSNPRRLSYSRSSPLWRAVSAALLSGILLAGAGCDTFDSDQGKADKRVRDALKKSTAARRQPSDKNLDKVVIDLNAALKETNASDTRKIAARSLLAETEFERGDKIALDLIPKESQIASLIWQIDELGAKIHGVNLEVESLNKSDPATTIAAIATQRSAMDAEAQAAAKKAGEIQAQIAAAQGKIGELMQQQQALRTQADADRAKASKLTGKEQAVVLDAVTESMRKAENLGHEIFKLSGALTPAGDANNDKPWEDPKSKALIPFQQDLAVENDKKARAEKTVVELNEMEKSVKEGWDAIKAQMEERKKAATALGEQLKTTAAELATLETEAAALRDTALARYKSAETAWAGSATDAGNLGKQLTTWAGDVKYAKLPEAKAWKNLADTYNHHFFKLMQGRALDRAGNRHAAHAALLEAKTQTAQKIDAALKAASVTLPPSLTSTTSEASKTASMAAFDASLALYKDIFEYGRNPDLLKDTAKLSNMFTLYGEYHLSGDATKLAAAKAQFAEIFTAEKRGEAKVDNFVKLLPADLRA